MSLAAVAIETSAISAATVPGAPPVALVTGAARRLGAAIAEALHRRGYNIAVHYGRSAAAAEALCRQLNRLRANSAVALQADLRDLKQTQQLAHSAIALWGRVDTLINNASAFYPTSMATVGERQWDDLLASNLKGPFFLSHALAAELSARNGTIVSLADINGRAPLKGYPVYSIAKAGVVMMVKALARELAPQVRVNGIAPGAILWPEGDAAMDEAVQQQLLAQIPLGRLGTEADIAALAVLLAAEPGYLTGQVIAVDGGLSLVAHS